MKRSLLVLKPDGSKFELALDRPVIKVGRVPDNDLVLTDDNRSVSRSHAAITCRPSGTISISDLNSANGTFVNGTRISSSVELTAGDTVKIGSFQLTLQEETEEDTRFKIEAGTVGLEVLQKQSALMSLDGVADRKNLELLYEVGVKLAGSHSIEAVAGGAVELLFKIDLVHRAAVILWDQEKGNFGNLGLKTRDGMRVGSLPSSYDPAKVVMSRTILNRVRQKNVPLLIRDAKSVAMMDPESSIVSAGIQAALCSPLSFQGQFLGILYADNLADPDAFSETDFRTFATIASQTGLALSSAITRVDLMKRNVQAQIVAKSLELAREIQMGLVPKEFPALPEFKEVDLFAALVPALEVGGDLYDFFALDKDRICFIIGDVSSKGIPAALFMAMTRTAFKISAMSSPESIAATMGRVNQFLCESNPQQMFVTAFAGILDLQTGRVDYADAGHEPPFVLGPDGSVKNVSKVGGVVLGLLSGREFRAGTLQLRPGDSLFLYTDGVTEAMNIDNQFFGAGAIQTSLSRAGKGVDSERIIRTMLEDLRGFVGEARQSDDIAMLVIRYLGRDVEAPPVAIQA